VCLLLLAVAAGVPGSLSGQARAPAYFGIQPGAAGRAQIDLLLGEPLRRPAPDQPVYEYAPARGDADSLKIVVSFDADTMQVARLDVYLKAPVAANLLRDKFGTVILSRDRSDGGREEFFFPQLYGVILSGRAADAAAVAVSYLGPRTMGSVYARRSAERLAAKVFDDARTDADKAVAIDPDGAEGYLAQGHVLLAQKDDDEALVRYTAAATAKYGPAEKFLAQMALAQVYLEKKNWPDKAATAYQGAIAVAAPADRARAHLAYGKFLADQKKPDESLVEFGRAADADPDNIDARVAAAEAYYSRKDFAHALPHYAALSQHADAMPGFTFAALSHFRYAYCLNETGRAADAVRVYQKVLNDPKLKASALNNLGVIAEHGGDPGKAVDYYSQAVRIDTAYVTHNHNLARALLGAGRFDEALQQTEVTWGLKANDPEVAFTMARCWGALRKKKETLQWVEGAIAVGFGDRKRLTTDPHLAFVQNDSGFKKLLLLVK
jgi:tetratricopeptide (TPR) repeat protein